ncbi:unnamed protein product [Didymodactylos carnosus]|uniref:G-protein coupled receptors family 1 profile domain-containing protein n=1 Tax=Didymodactylos carnosus TaxID=1234261 RepID=A0A815H7F5_9BILA|nr:unnamed protein product [Didymodactylos carnosus]CAF1394612.1 unnamed protein product [Didymodactylos carnosus]CAF4201998.1 unnamed protein product [Didymodactylos carnosus]CAF4215968.1 unnamed protein product [Didymodactylos carnosus]
MMVATTGSSIVTQLDSATSQLNRFIPIPLLVLGTIGNIFNAIIFSRRSLKRLPCSIYFLSSTICNFLALYSGLITPYLNLYDLDPTSYSTGVCKIRFYIRYTSITLSSWFILLACIDRYVSSSHNARIRGYSRLTLAYRVTIITILIGISVPFTQTFYCYEIINKSCTTRNTGCKLANDIILLSSLSFIPPMAMVLFTLLTIRNVKRMNMSTKRRHIQLVRMLFAQVMVMVILYSLPVTAQKLYSDSTAYLTGKPSIRVAIENLAQQISTNISYINNSVGFYIYILTGTLFRKEWMRVLVCQKSNAISSIHTKHQSINTNTIGKR